MTKTRTNCSCMPRLCQPCERRKGVPRLCQPCELCKGVPRLCQPCELKTTPQNSIGSISIATGLIPLQNAALDHRQSVALGTSPRRTGLAWM